MKIIEPKYEILTDISEGGIKELQQNERVARVCYKSEDKITPDGESAKKLVGFLMKQGHEAISIKELAETVKNMEKIQLLLLKVALAFIKIDKESMVNENAAKNV